MRQPASRHQREVNVWRLFESAVSDVRTAIAALGRDRRPARFAADLDELGGVGAANVLWIRCRPAVVGQYLPPDGVDLVLGSPAPPPSVDEMSFEYLATAWLMGREAAETLRLEPLFGTTQGRGEPAEGTAMRHAMASAAGALKPGGWCNILIEGGDVDRMLAVAVAGAAADLELVDVVHRESVRSGEGVALHFHKTSAEDRLRSAMRRARSSSARRTGTSPTRSWPRRSTGPRPRCSSGAASRSAWCGSGRPCWSSCSAPASCRASPPRAVRRRRRRRPNRPPRSPRRRRGRGPERGPNLLATLLREELARDDHPSLVRLGDADRPLWWLRKPELSETPLADRVEWATFSILTTAGRLDENGFLERIYALFPGLEAPDEELVRACLAAYAAVGEKGQLRIEEDLARRQEDHARIIGTLIDYGHRLGLRSWVGRHAHDRPYAGATLLERLRDDERRAYLPLIVRAPAETLAAIDAIWYVRGRMAFMFDVEWTAMLGETILRRGRQIEPTDQQARFCVFPGERTELLRLKLDRSPWLRAEVARQNWHFLKWQHLEGLAARDGASLDWLEPVLGLDPLIERGGEQLTMFGE